MIGLLAVAIGVLVYWQHNDEGVDDNNSPIYSDVNSGAVHAAEDVIIPIWMAIIVLCLILTITEIVLLARQKLKPLTFLIMNVVKSTIWTVIFVFDVISAVDNSSRTASAIAIIIEAVLLLCFWIPLIYGSIIYHRFRKEAKSYKPVDHPLSNPLEPTEYPSQYKAYVQEHVDEEAGSIPGYNHQRDTRFESYRQDQTSFSDVTERPIGIPIPQVHVEHHDGEVYEMESSRRDLR